jgi:hypothetical protein
VYLVLFAANVIRCECDRGCCHIHQAIHAITVKPLPRDIHADIGAVLMVRKDDFHIEAALPKILHRLPSGGDESTAGDIAIHTGHIHGQTKLDGVGRLRLGTAPMQPPKAWLHQPSEHFFCSR